MVLYKVGAERTQAKRIGDMKLVKGDKLVCVKPIGNLVYGKTYLVIRVRHHEIYPKIATGHEEDYICIDDIWWFGQIGSTEPWTNWFVLEKQWKREEKLKELGI